MGKGPVSREVPVSELIRHLKQRKTRTVLTVLAIAVGTLSGH
jgi:hypothetical protein